MMLGDVYAMEKWNIIADSSCDLFPSDIACKNVGFLTIPFSLMVDKKEYIDDESLNTSDLLTNIENSALVPHTACPGPGQWAEAFKETKRAVAITISGRLSGSYSSANTARETILEEDPEKKILLLDSRSTGPAMVICVRKLKEWILDGYEIEEIATKANHLLDRTHTIFALASFDNLVKNGRVNSFMGFIAKKLGIWGVGAVSQQGEIQIKGKARGANGALSMIVDDMKRHGYCGGEVVISHCHNMDTARRLKHYIQEKWPFSRVIVLPTRGLNSFYAERGGLIVSYVL